MKALSLLTSTPGATLDFLLAANRTLHGAVPLARRIAVASADGGTGCSTVAASVATTMAGRHPGPVVLVDAGRNGPGACVRAGLTAEARQLADEELAAARPGDEDEEEPRPPATLAEAMTGLPRTASGLVCLDMTRDRFPGCLGLRAWADTLAPISRFPDFIVTDFGVRDRDELSTIATANHATCIVTSAARERLTRAIALATWLEDEGHAPLVCINDTSGGVSRRQLRLLSRALPRPAILVPHDPARLGAEPARSAALSQRSRNAVLELTASLMTACQQTPGAVGGITA
ncbi:hypothetical protein [Propionibacterium australiense]|uniref:P-loop containing nucleoside triphosphate hydrolase n=1 Tax=Propionibacterium australiense TaxID=119981 RepID=A0A383S704_9ACTN|nr:hypothetical protein [Propionibacterium australiense]RLP10105.1 hypothetical protein D9T14_06140 [Propionibacterium australiense]RLP11390.1 hypothetical protein D7U36_04580 [Propionibacterium australiense]SYZ33036.1 P-loop containing nucleoside triphosphate hydrolase [Propionibacterium australiense]VEH92197.1 Flp pilus assembly protein, ATPase CpaE [Propionibacterium australiense]